MPRYESNTVACQHLEGSSQLRPGSRYSGSQDVFLDQDLLGIVSRLLENQVYLHIPIPKAARLKSIAAVDASFEARHTRPWI